LLFALQQKVENFEQQKDSVISGMKNHFEKKLLRLEEIESENDKNKLKLAEIQDELEAIKSREKELKMELNKKEMTIQKLK